MAFLHSLWIHTMNRCITPLIQHRRSLLLAALALGLGGAACAQDTESTTRFVPLNTHRGILEVTQPPNVLVNGQNDRLSPGARIRGTNGMLLLSSHLVGQQLPMRFNREPNGLIHEVWILTPEEFAQQPQKPSAFVGPVQPAPAPAKPGVARDDGKTPFDQLPKYPNQ